MIGPETSAAVSSSAYRQTRVSRLGWWIILLLFFAATINYVDRQTLSLVQPRLVAEFHFSNVQYGSMVSWFLAAYAVMYTLSGSIIDVVGSRLGMALSIVVWSVAEMLHAAATGLTSFRFYRLLLGTGEPGMFPAAVKTVREYFVDRQRALAFGVFNAGTSVGPAIAPPLIVWILSRWGWRAAFLATGALGLIWLAPWLWISGVAEREMRPSGVPAAGAVPGPGWRSLLRHRQVWGILLGRTFADPAWYFYLFWLPPYLFAVRHFSMAAIGHYGAELPYISAAFGNIFGGWASAALIRRGVGVVRARKLAMLITVALMPVVFLGTRSASDAVVIGAISLATFAHQSWSSNISTLPADVIPASLVGSVAGLAGSAGSLAGVAFTTFTAWAADHHHYAWVFLVASSIYLVGWLLVNWLVRREWREEAELTSASLPAR